MHTYLFPVTAARQFFNKAQDVHSLFKNVSKKDPLNLVRNNYWVMSPNLDKNTFNNKKIYIFKSN